MMDRWRYVERLLPSFLEGSAMVVFVCLFVCLSVFLFVCLFALTQKTIAPIDLMFHTRRVIPVAQSFSIIIRI